MNSTYTYKPYKVYFILPWITVYFALTLTPRIHAQPLDSSWTLSIGAETIQVNNDGTFYIPNISAPDEFGPGGPGTRPDFLSDDWVRLTGYSTLGGTTRYCWSEPFRLTQDQTVIISLSELTFSDTPPPVPKSLLIESEKRTLTSLNETVELDVTAFLADDTTKDASSAEDYTTYRTSNINIASISSNGLVTAKAEGRVFITAINEGVTAVTQINIAPGASLTEISGVVTLPDGTPVEGAEVVLAGLGLTVTTGADGSFSIPEVPISDTLKIDAITVQLSTTEGSFFGSTNAPELEAGSITDAGLIELMDLCTELGQEACLDSDNDCIPDAIEIVLGLDPNDPDSDDNTIPDGEEDTDLDGLTTCAEIFLGTDPELEDSDGDGLTDGEEVFALDTDPRNSDSDFDGLSDGDELFPDSGRAPTDPLKADSDLDGYDDGLEWESNTDPLDPTSRPPVRVYSSRINFLNTLTEKAPRPNDSDIVITSNVVSFLNADETQVDSITTKTRISSAVASYLNNIEEAPSTEGSVIIVSNPISFLNAQTQADATSAPAKILISSKPVSFLNATVKAVNKPEKITITSKIVSILNQP